MALCAAHPCKRKRSNGKKTGLQGVLHDWLAVTGTASLAGILRLNFGYTPTLGPTFVVLTSGGLRTGTFSTLIQPSGWDVVATYNPHDVTLTVAAVPEPETYALMFAGLALVGFAAWRRKLACAPQIG